MQRWMLFLGVGLFCMSLSLQVHAAKDDSVSKQIQMLNEQLQVQLQRMQETQQKQVQTLNKQLQKQLKETQTKLQAQIEDVNKTTQDKMKAIQKTLHAEIKHVQEQVLTGGGAPLPAPQKTEDQGTDNASSGG